MADAPKFLAVLQAVDRITGPIGGIMGKLKGLGGAIRSDFANPWKDSVGDANKQVESLGHGAKKAGHEIEKVAHHGRFEVLSGHVRLLRTHFGNLNASVGEVGHSLSDMLPMLAGLGGIASLAGLGEMLDHVVESQSALQNTAAAIGVTSKQLLVLNLAAEHADVPVQQMQLSMERLNAVVGAAKTGANKSVAGLFHHLGISLKDAHGHGVPLAALLPKLMDAFKHTKDSALRSRMAMMLFGRVGPQLMAFLREGAEGWREYNAESSRVDYDPTKKERDGLEKFHSSWIDLRHAVDSVQVAIGSKLGPVLRPIVDQFKIWVTNNREWVATKVVDAIKGLAAALKKIDIKDIVQDFGFLAKHAINLASALGPMPMTIGAVTLALGSPFLHAVTGAIRDLKELVTWALDAAKAIGTTLVDALKDAGTAMKGLDASFHATTIGRTAAIAFEIYDLAHKKQILHENAAQKHLVAGWHLKTGQALTSAQATQFRHLATPQHHGPSFDQRARAAVAHFLGIDGAPAPPSLIAQGLASGAGGAMGPAPAPTKVIVEFKNAPPGTRVRTEQTRGAATPDLHVGYATPAFGF